MFKKKESDSAIDVRQHFALVIVLLCGEMQRKEADKQ